MLKWLLHALDPAAPDHCGGSPASFPLLDLQVVRCEEMPIATNSGYGPFPPPISGAPVTAANRLTLFSEVCRSFLSKGADLSQD